MPVATHLLTLILAGALGPPQSPVPSQSLGPPRSVADDGTTDIVAAAADPVDRMTVPVHIGGGGAYRFLVDTGAQNTVVSAELARSLALNPSGVARVTGTAGSVEVATVTLDDLRLGRRSFRNLTAPLFAAREIGADGVIGLDSLQRQRVVLDFARNLIVVDDAAADPGGDGFDIVVRARRRSGQLIVTQARLNGVRVDVVLDTGADTSIGNLALAAAVARHAPLSPAMLRSITGQAIAANVAMARSLTIGSLSLANVSVAYADSPPFALLGLGRRPALLLGMNELRAFKRVAIDFDRRTVSFKLPPGLAIGPVNVR